MSSETKKSIETATDLLTAVIEHKKGGEVRSQQQEAVIKISECLSSTTNALVEAPTGAGKTIAYLVPLIFHGSRAVVSTATKQLTDQISSIDVPFLQKTLKSVAPEKKTSFALLKGRENYFCLAKAEDNRRLSQQADALFSMEESVGETQTAAKAKRMGTEIKLITDWAEKTKTGDRTEAPAVGDDTWRQFSSTTSECPGKKVCPFGDVCFAEYARENARKADIVITNHAVVGNDLMSEESSLLGERDVYVFDELHELDSYLSSAWGTSLTAKMIKDAHKTFNQLSTVNRQAIDDVELLSKKFNGLCSTLEEGLIESPPKVFESYLARLHTACTKITMDAAKDAKNDELSEGARKNAAVVVKKAQELSDAAKLLMDDGPDTVRWVKIDDDDVRTLYAAPLRVGPQLQEALAHRDAFMVGTSATIRVSGSFDIPVHNLDLDASKNYETVALGSPFDYPKQAFMYIPSPDNFPAPIGKERAEHTEAVQKEMIDLITASGGRALCLFTTSYAAREGGKVLRKAFPRLNILIQGEAPNQQLIEDFQKDEKSVLVATMGMWHGLDVPGPACSLVIMDKIPFKPMNDPLSTARQKWAEENGRNGFMDVYVAEANVMLAQGAGRLIRSSKDKGVVAILDTRLLSKRYGQSMLKSLPPMMVFSDKSKVIGGLERLAKSLDA